MADKTVMIIEDDVLHMKLFNDVLESHGYKTMRAADSDLALKLAHEAQPDLIILDIRLPFTSGFDVIKLIRADEDLKHIPVVAVTALADDMDESDYRSKGFDGFLAKPIAIPNFLKTVAGFIRPTLCRLDSGLSQSL